MRVTYARGGGCLHDLPRAGRIDVVFVCACAKENSHIYPHRAVSASCKRNCHKTTKKKDDLSIILLWRCVGDSKRSSRGYKAQPIRASNKPNYPRNPIIARVTYARGGGCLHDLPRAGRIDVVFAWACTKANSHIYPHCAVSASCKSLLPYSDKKKDDLSIILLWRCVGDSNP